MNNQNEIKLLWKLNCNLYFCESFHILKHVCKQVTMLFFYLKKKQPFFSCSIVAEQLSSVLFTRPKKLIRSWGPEASVLGYVGIGTLSEGMCRYDLNEEDVAWLEVANREFSQMGECFSYTLNLLNHCIYPTQLSFNPGNCRGISFSPFPYKAFMKSCVCIANYKVDNVNTLNTS